MSDKFTIELHGTIELQARLQKATSETQRKMVSIIQRGVGEMAAEAKLAAPGYFGNLRNMISSADTDKGADLISGADYSAYVEFGTGTKVDVPSDLTEFALQFKGHKEVIGMRAQPFFFPTVKRKAPDISKDITNYLDSI